MIYKRCLAMTAIVGALFLPACLLIPTPGADGSGCSVESGVEGKPVIVCDDGSTAPLFPAAGDAGVAIDDDRVSDAGVVEKPERDAGSLCLGREALLDGGVDPCGRFVVDGGFPGNQSVRPSP